MELTERELTALMTIHSAADSSATPTGDKYDGYHTQLKQALSGAAQTDYGCIAFAGGRVMLETEDEIGMKHPCYLPILFGAGHPGGLAALEHIRNQPKKFVLTGIRGTLRVAHSMLRMTGQNADFFSFIGVVIGYNLKGGLRRLYGKGIKVSTSKPDGCVVCGTDDLIVEEVAIEDVVKYLYGSGYDDDGNPDGLFDEQREKLSLELRGNLN